MVVDNWHRMDLTKANRTFWNGSGSKTWAVYCRYRFRAWERNCSTPAAVPTDYTLESINSAVPSAYKQLLCALENGCWSLLVSLSRRFFDCEQTLRHAKCEILNLKGNGIHQIFTNRPTKFPIIDSTGLLLDTLFNFFLFILKINQSLLIIFCIIFICTLSILRKFHRNESTWKLFWKKQ